MSAGSSEVRQVSLTGTTNEEKIWNYLIGQGLTAHGVAGLMGNMQAESGFVPTNMENAYESRLGFNDTTYTQAVDNGTYTNFVKDAVGYGLCQFTYYTLKQQLLDFAKAQGKSIGDLEMQLAFTCNLFYEQYPGIWKTLTTTTSVKEASNAVLLQFERPADQSTSAQNKRASYGEAIYQKYANSTRKEDKAMATAKQVLAPVEALAGEKESVVGSNNTTVNKYYNAKGQAYCGYTVMYGFAKAGSKLLDGSGAYNVGNLARFCENKGWRVTTPQKGDIFVQRAGGYENGHTGFVYENLGNGYFITLEGNYGSVKATYDQAKNGTGSSYEGIGYRKQKITTDYKFYRPAYDGASSGGSTPSPAPTPAQPSVGAAVTITMNLIKKGHSGPQVKTIQRVCYAYGIKGSDGKAISVDGDFGANTDYAVRALQKKLGVSVDGQVGKDTWTAILTKLG